MKAMLSDMQPMLFDLPPILRVKADQPLTTRERFDLFHAANPAVYARLRDMAFAMQRRGVQQWGCRAAWEILRWQGMLSTSDGQYKLPNDLAPHYARLLMDQEPSLAGFFETRKLRKE